MQPFAAEKLLGRTVYDLDIRNSHSRKVVGGDAGQQRVAFEGHDAAEMPGEIERIDPQPAGEVQHRVARDPFVGGCRFARCLLEGPRRQDALRGGIRREFAFGACEVLDLRGDKPGMGNRPVERHLQRVAAPGGGNRLPELVATEQVVFLGGDHGAKAFVLRTQR